VEAALAVSGAAFQHVLGPELADEEVQEACERWAQDDSFSIIACRHLVVAVPAEGIVLDRQLGRFAAVRVELREQSLGSRQRRGQAPPDACKGGVLAIRDDAGSHVEAHTAEQQMRAVVRRHGRPGDLPRQGDATMPEAAKERDHDARRKSRARPMNVQPRTTKINIGTSRQSKGTARQVELRRA